MSVYLSLYIFVIISLFSMILVVYLKYKYIEYWKYFIFTSLGYLFRNILYLMSLTITYEQSFLLLLSRLMYGITLISSYVFLLFLNNFGSKNNNINYKRLILLLPIVIMTFLTIFSPYIIKQMFYNQQTLLNYELFGELHLIYVFLYFIYPFLYLYLFIKRYKILTKLNQMRLFYICSGFFITIILEWIFLLILPIFGIWKFQKEQIIFFIPLILSVYYAIYRYYFYNIGLLVKKLFIYLFSTFISVNIIALIKYYFAYILDDDLANLWIVNANFGIVDLSIGIVVFIIVSKLLHFIIGDNLYVDLVSKVSQLQKKVSFISTFTELGKLLNTEFKNIFTTNFVNIKLNNTGDNLDNLKKYFTGVVKNNIFIKDKVFIEENKNKFKYDLLKKEISDEAYLIFPLYNNKREFIGIFEIGNKRLKNTYTKEEIDILRGFIAFLEGHLRYLKIYSNINELNLTLDKKVDEKTIEYNNLINRQNDFISLASHEIKNPLGFCIFQTDCILDDVKSGDFSKEDLLKELELLNNQLLRVGDLTKSIFDMQKFDINKSRMYLKNINIVKLLNEKLNLYSKMHKNADLKFESDLKDFYLKIDKIQLEQVIDNLVLNSIKYNNSQLKKVIVSLYKKEDYIELTVEDNGLGIKYENLKTIFDKYSTGESNSIGLGMGLYLCKKIVELHGGEISADKSDNLGGAIFMIKLPLKYDGHY